MLLKKKDLPEFDFLENWPAHYYKIKDIIKRKEFLEKAITQNLDSEHDCYRMKLLNRRFFKENKKGTTDSFMLAWIMIKASASSGDAFIIKKKKRELENDLKNLCLCDFTPENEAEQQVLEEEWSDFARCYLSSCVESKNYCSTLFNMIPLKDDAVAKKIVAEINLVTLSYPSKFGLENFMAPLRQIMIHTFCQMIENGASYWDL